jgi:hypothetical protein
MGVGGLPTYLSFTRIGDPPSRDHVCEECLGMKKLSVLCIVLCVSLSTTATFARGGGMGSHMSGGMSVTGGAFGTSPAAPGTNSLGTALSSPALAAR